MLLSLNGVYLLTLRRVKRLSLFLGCKDYYLSTLCHSFTETEHWFQFSSTELCKTKWVCRKINHTSFAKLNCSMKLSQMYCSTITYGATLQRCVCAQPVIMLSCGVLMDSKKYCWAKIRLRFVVMVVCVCVCPNQYTLLKTQACRKSVVRPVSLLLY